MCTSQLFSVLWLAKEASESVVRAHKIGLKEVWLMHVRFLLLEKLVIIISFDK